MELEPKAVDVATAARYLGVSRSVAYLLCGKGELRSWTVGRSRRISLVEIDRFIREREQAAEAASATR